MNKRELRFQYPQPPPILPIVKIRDFPLTKEQIGTAQNVLDEQRFKDNEQFQYQLYQQHFDHPLEPPMIVERRDFIPNFQIYTQMPNMPNMPNMHNIQMMHNQMMHNQIIPIQEELNFTTINNNLPWTQPPLPEYLDPKKSIDLKLIRKPNKKDKRCYTCKPRGKVKKHMINASESGIFIFSHDMHKRPVIIMTPVRHIESIDQMTPEELNNLFKSIKEFTGFWNIDDYQISFNSGAWKNHDHFHVKIRISEKQIARMRRDHFERLKMESRYPNI